MGLDITMISNNDDLYSGSAHDYFYKHSLSRTFCNLMCRRDAIVDEEPELDQISELTGIDISPLYELNNYPDADAMDYFLSSANNDTERRLIIERAEADKLKLNHNIDSVILIIDSLIDKLSQINDLASLFSETEHDTLNRKVYFKDFTTDIGDGYIGNNFGRDLRNFKDFLAFAKSKGTTGIHFNYG